MSTKFISVVSLFSILTLSLFSQAYDYPDRRAEALEFTPNGYLGLSTGINNFNGLLGINGEIRVINNFTIAGGAGIGSWGYKLAGAVRYYIHYPKGLYFAIGYSSAIGAPGVEIELETTRPGGNQMVELDLHPANNLNLSASYQWRLGRRFRLGLEFGYSFPLQDRAWELVSEDVILSDASEEVMDFLTPGGLVLGFGFSIGL